MTVRRIVIHGDPVLHTPTQPVADFSTDLAELVADLFDTMYAGGGVGLIPAGIAFEPARH